MSSHRSIEKIVLLAAIGTALVACKPEAPAPDAAPTASIAAPATAGMLAAASAVAPLHDEISSDARRVIGISYPQGLEQYPQLQQAIATYAQAQRAQLDAALNALGDAKPSAPYELSLQFAKTLDTPKFIVVSANGTLYTGGAHGSPLLQNFVWSPQQNRRLTVEALILSAQGWAVISDNVREQLHTQASVRADDVDDAGRADWLRDIDKMIDDGTEPKAENFRQFMPLLDASGQVRALRFIFAPYQVGPYSDGTRNIDVPIAVVRPYIAPGYAALFAD